VKKFLIIMLIVFVSISILCLQGFAQTKTIVFITPETDPLSIKLDNSFINRFEEEHPGVKVNITHSDIGGMLTKVSAQLRAGTAPDVAFFTPRYVAQLAEQGFLLPLDDLFEDIGDINRKYVTSTLDGKIYNIPISANNFLIYYRTDLLEKAGIKPPTTFNELLEAAEALTLDIDGDGNIDQYGISLPGGIPLNWGFFASFMWSNGGEFFDKNKNVTIDSPEAIEALDFLGKLSKFAPPSMVLDRTSETQIQFARGISAMGILYGRIFATINQYNPEISSKIDVITIPIGPSGTKSFERLTFDCFVVFSGTKYPDIAKEFIKSYISGDHYLDFLLSVPGHLLPIRSSWADNPKYFENPEIKKYGDIIKKTITDIMPKYGTDIDRRFDGVNIYLAQAIADPTLTTEINKFFLGNVTAEQTLKNVANSWRKKFNIE